MRKWIGIGIILIAIGAAGLLSPWSGWQDDWFGTVQVNEKTSIKAEGIERLKVDTDSEDVRIVPGGEGEIVVRLEGKASAKQEQREKLDAVAKDGTLSVRALQQQAIVGFNIVRLKMTIEVPLRTYESITVDTDSGDVELVGLAADAVLLKSDSGDFMAKQLKAKTIEADTDSGDQVFEDSEGSLKSESDSGDLLWSAKELAWGADIRTDSGDVAFQLARKPVNGSVSYTSDSGDGVIGWGAGIVDSGGTLSQTFGTGSPAVKVFTDSGDFTMNEQQ
ncbi:DUF4097 family beta strand repeat-containing protein [Paenibacillus sp. MMS18-CY102]|uniref:DUF4097 family beta strand repeat-containing protein n=1 Tax=Paenibacillus sp. MMS18-CY102 TaxID=2682849 RepID=UPI001365DE51|nr:DUF4097 family beta strand repeat-containing protein [Paenibacillus sp. MMS18-CY102]MWC29461.1 DUF4097 family beta strand repeat protein [Paenibacillus sp. MMS18-CY102]